MGRSAHSTATAAKVKLVDMGKGVQGIASASNLQIVNGGQTTASILYARDQTGAELDKVFVQMKLSVVAPEKVKIIVPKISRFSNTQNKINPIGIALLGILRHCLFYAPSDSVWYSRDF